MFESDSDWQDRLDRHEEEERPDPHEDDHITGVCEACGAECTSVSRDDGIGPYEYWGSTGTHHEWVEVSPCCEAPVVSNVEYSEYIARKAEETQDD